MRSLIGRPKRQEDPAPSRLAYRLHRIMLRPVLRFAVIYGLPVGLVPRERPAHRRINSRTKERGRTIYWCCGLDNLLRTKL